MIDRSLNVKDFIIPSSGCKDIRIKGLENSSLRHVVTGQIECLPSFQCHLTREVAKSVYINNICLVYF